MNAKEVYDRVVREFGAENGFPTFTEERVMRAIEICLAQQNPVNGKETANAGTPDADQIFWAVYDLRERGLIQVEGDLSTKEYWAKLDEHTREIAAILRKHLC